MFDLMAELGDAIRSGEEDVAAIRFGGGLEIRIRDRDTGEIILAQRDVQPKAEPRE